MKKIVKRLLPLIGCSSLGLVGCGAKPIVQLGWTSEQGEYTYTSDKHGKTTFRDLEAATNEYFDTVSEFAFTEDVLKHCTDRWLDLANESHEILTLSLFKLDKVNHRVTMHYEMIDVDGTSSHKKTADWNNVPIRLIYGTKDEEYKDKWCIIPLGFDGQWTDLLPNELKNDHNWSFISSRYENDTIIDSFELNYKVEHDDKIGAFSTGYYSSTFFSDVVYTPQP